MPKRCALLTGILASPEGHWSRAITPGLLGPGRRTPSGPPAQEQPAVVYRYTTNGAEPTVDSPVFTEVEPGETIILSVKAFAEGRGPVPQWTELISLQSPGCLRGCATGAREHPDALRPPLGLGDWHLCFGAERRAGLPLGGQLAALVEGKSSGVVGEDGGSATARFDLEIRRVVWAEPQRSFRLTSSRNGPPRLCRLSIKPDIHQFET